MVKNTPKSTAYNPVTYLSYSDGMYRVIHQALPINDDTPDRDHALRCAAHFKLTVAPHMWNGDRLDWIENGAIGS